MSDKITSREVDGIIPMDKFDLMILGAGNYENLSSYYNQCLLKAVDKPKDKPIILSTDIYCCFPTINVERYDVDIDCDYLRFPSLFIYRETVRDIEAYFLDNSKWSTANIMYTFNKETSSCIRVQHIDANFSSDVVDFLESLMLDINSKIYLVI